MIRTLLASTAAAVLLTGCSPQSAEAGRAAPAAQAPASSAPGAAQAPAAQVVTADQQTLSCSGPITPETTEAQLRERFGAGNVTTGPIYAAEGMSVPGIVVFADDPARRLEIIPSEGPRRVILSVAARGPGSTWRGPGNLRVGSSLQDVERANGRAFQVSGFGWDYGGWVLDWSGGTFAAADDAPCRVSVRLAPAEDSASEQALGEGAFRSDSAAVRSQRPVVSEWSIDFNVPGAHAPDPS